MSLKLLHVALFGDAADRPLLDSAALLAKHFAAHLDVVHAERSPADDLPMLEAPIAASTVQAIIEESESDIAARANAAKQAFDQWCANADIALNDDPGEADEASATWSQIRARPSELIARRGRFADMILVAGPDGSDDGDVRMASVEAALTESGKPVLLTPKKAPSGVGKIVAVGWNGSAEAARAVTAAMPLLREADRVVLLAAPEKSGNGEDVAQLATSLAWHGIPVDIHRFTAKKDVGEELIAAAASVKADLLVIGAYSHNRLREMVFGGVTRHVLKGVAIPVLLVH